MGNPDTSPLVAEFEAHSAEAAQFLKVLGNQHRLLVLCYLITFGEMPVSALVAQVGLSQSALSQHLAKLRALGLVATRREAQTIYYRAASNSVGAVIDTLHGIYYPSKAA